MNCLSSISVLGGLKSDCLRHCPLGNRQPQKGRLKPLFFRQLTKVFGLLTVAKQVTLPFNTHSAPLREVKSQIESQHLSNRWLKSWGNPLPERRKLFSQATAHQ
ncbi:hypothetical protein [Scytonema sp. PCC 10023]|uniref:hypothetical protein n=1 Tax=Scytonema sp. PCC 10023 TaxID=1680591 RepID=UPI0039C6C287